MATLSVTMPDPILPRVEAAIAYQNGYRAQVPGPNGTTISNPVSVSAFAGQKLREYLLNLVRVHEATSSAAIAAAKAQALADIDAEVLLS